MAQVNRLKIDKSASIYQIQDFYHVPQSRLKTNFRYLNSDIYILIINPNGDLNDPAFKTVVLYTESGTRRVSLDEYSYYEGSMTGPMFIELRRLGIPLKKLGDINTHLLYGKTLTTIEIARSKGRNVRKI